MSRQCSELKKCTERLFAVLCRRNIVGHIPVAKTVVVCWLLIVPATCKCISGMDLLTQFYMLPHWDRSCKPNVPSHPVTEYWHQADQSQHWSYNTRHLAPLECQVVSHWYDSTLKKSGHKWEPNPGSSVLEWTPKPQGHQDDRAKTETACHQ